MSNPDIGGAQQQSGHPAAALGQLTRRSRSSAGGGAGAGAHKSLITATKVVRARQTPDHAKDDESPTGAKPLNPCKLVSLTEAQTITGGTITKLIEAPLGPTCIYSGQRSSGAVTLAVETERLSRVTSHMKARKHVVISGHRSICGRLGTQMLLVPLGRYQLLNVTAPCGVAQRFAVLAVSRLSA